MKTPALRRALRGLQLPPPHFGRKDRSVSTGGSQRFQWGDGRSRDAGYAPLGVGEQI